jgi:hypothetical protein|tara:strand:- start:602 stop:991 length:390 start_codon:yes stop_codon:yes gene_type:complete
MKKIILMICLLFTPGVTILITPHAQAVGPILELDPADHWEGGNPRITVNTMDVQCALKGAIFGHSWQKHQDGISEIKLIEDLVIKLTDDGAPPAYIKVWVAQMKTALKSDNYMKMVGEVVYLCLEYGGV